MKTHVIFVLFALTSATTGDVYKRVTDGRTCTAAESKQNVFLTSGGFKCLGSVIGDGSWVLTAAHCDQAGKEFTVTDMAKHSVTVNDRAHVIKYEITDVNDPSKKTHHDIMLIKLPEKLNTHANLPGDKDCEITLEPNHSHSKSELVFVGRDTATMATTDAVMCAEAFIGSCLGHYLPGQFIFCGKPTISSKTCSGDSGGGVLAGGVLRGVNFGKDPQYTCYAIAMDICRYKQWIVDTMNKL